MPITKKRIRVQIEDSEDEDSDQVQAPIVLDEVPTAGGGGGGAVGQPRAWVWAPQNLHELRGRTVWLSGRGHPACGELKDWRVVSVCRDDPGNRILQLREAKEASNQRTLLFESLHPHVVLKYADTRADGVDAEVQTTEAGGRRVWQQEDGSAARTGSHEASSTTDARRSTGHRLVIGTGVAGPSGVTTTEPWPSNQSRDSSIGSAAVGNGARGEKSARPEEAGDETEEDGEDGKEASPPQQPPNKKRKKKKQGRSSKTQAAGSKAAAYVPSLDSVLAKNVDDEVREMLASVVGKLFASEHTRRNNWGAVGGALMEARKVGPEDLRKQKLSLPRLLRLLENKDAGQTFEAKFAATKNVVKTAVLAWLQEKKEEHGSSLTEQPQTVATETDPERETALQTPEAHPILTQILDAEAAVDLYRFIVRQQESCSMKTINGTCVYKLGKALWAFRNLATEATHKWEMWSKKTFHDLATKQGVLEAAVAQYSENASVKRMMRVLLDWAGVHAEVVNEAMDEHKQTKQSYLKQRLEPKTYKDFHGFLCATLTELSVRSYLFRAGCGLKAALEAAGRANDIGLTREDLRQLLVESRPCAAAIAATKAVYASYGADYHSWRTGLLAWLEGRKAAEKEEKKEVDSAEDEESAEEWAASMKAKAARALKGRVKPDSWPAEIAHNHVVDHPELDGRRVDIGKIDFTARLEVKKGLPEEAIEFFVGRYASSDALYEGKADTGWWWFLKDHKDVPEVGSALHRQINKMLKDLEESLLSRGVVPSHARPPHEGPSVDWTAEVDDTPQDCGKAAETEVERSLVKAIVERGIEAEHVVRPTLENARPDGMIDFAPANETSREVLATLRYQVKAASVYGRRQLAVPFGRQGEGRARRCYEGYLIFIVHQGRIAVTTNQGLLRAAKLELDGEDIEEACVISVEDFDSWVCASDQELVKQIGAIAQGFSKHRGDEKDVKIRLGQCTYPLASISDFRGAVIEMSPAHVIEHISRRVLRWQLGVTHGGEGPSISLELIGTGENDGGVVDYVFVCLDKGETGPTFKRVTGKMTHAPDPGMIDTVQAKSIWPVTMKNRVAHGFPLYHVVNGARSLYHTDEPVELVVGTVSSPEGMLAGSYFIPTAVIQMLDIAENTSSLSCHPPLQHVINRMSIVYVYKHTPWMSAFWFSAAELMDGTFAREYVENIRRIFVTPFKR